MLVKLYQAYLDYWNLVAVGALRSHFILFYENIFKRKPSPAVRFKGLMKYYQIINHRKKPEVEFVDNKKIHKIKRKTVHGIKEIFLQINSCSYYVFMNIN